ncbi:MAG: single-stranded-DNA-specific exonuclease RecJ [Flavobacteriia bacterium]|nr:single-stranded-DNA-specific exonuclease RecJ [Flavobacteriia bacterium]
MNWTLIASPPPAEVQALSKSLGIEERLGSLLVQRGVGSFEAAKTFFRPSFSLLHDPYLMKDMDLAVQRIIAAMEREEPILVYGDYDVDGTTAVALVADYLQQYYHKVATYIPDRYEEGYGVSFQGIDFAAANDIGLIIALDCGIKAIDKVAYAKEKGIDFIICDHHRPGASLPEAVAVLDPKRADCSYPYEEICGCGVGFKLIQALGVALEEDPLAVLPYLDLVATAIGADMVPLSGENRTLAYLGVQQMNTNPRPGFQAFIEQINRGTLSLTDLNFTIAPRINAAGRMVHGAHAVALLQTKDINQARTMAAAIQQHNEDRKELDGVITETALLQMAQAQESQSATSVVYDPNWHKGVIGIVASRLIETHYRPTLVFTQSGDVMAGSARSIKGYDIYNAIDACSEHVLQFGGHMYAAGLTLKNSQYPAFKAAFEAHVSATLDPALKIPEIQIDQEISISEITPKFMRILKQMAPFGPENPLPVFKATGVYETGYATAVGKDQTHLKGAFCQGTSAKISFIAFKLAHQLGLLADQSLVDIVFHISENKWQGKSSLQLQVLDIKPTV